MREIYKKISEINSSCGNYLCTLIDGTSAGEKALVSDGQLSWHCGEGSWAELHRTELEAVEESGVTAIDGTEIYVERVGAENNLVICGAGHVSMPIILLAGMTGWHVTVIDDRLRFANNAIERGADEVICKGFAEALEGIQGSENTYFVIVTRGHRYDMDCLRCVVDKPHAYIGMMGSRRRTAIVREELTAEGISAEVLDSVHTPIGLDIAAETPEEIAVAIMAEIIEVRNSREKQSGFLRDIMRILCSDEREDTVLATIIGRKGSAPRGVGTKMLIMRSGDTVGTVGGGCVEGAVIRKGMRMLMRGEVKPAVMNVDMTAEAAEDEGMVCGGVIDVLLELV